MDGYFVNSRLSETRRFVSISISLYEAGDINIHVNNFLNCRGCDNRLYFHVTEDSICVNEDLWLYTDVKVLLLLFSTVKQIWIRL